MSQNFEMKELHTATMLAMVAIALTACKPQPGEAEYYEQIGHKDGKHTLGIVGYNYTDHSIASFDVMGAGGSALGVSDEGGGGGGETCCVVWNERTPLPVKVKVRWAYDYCRYLSEPDPLYGNRIEGSQNFFREEEVELKGPVPERPTILEVHFYPDKHVELAIVSKSTYPRLKLDSNRRKTARRCTPEELKND